MSATDELRRLLDERGVKWDGEYYEGATFWNDETNLAVASEGRDGKLWVSQSLTPAQAIAATLGNDGVERSNDGVAELEAENKQLRKLCERFAEYVGEDRCEGCVVKTACRNAELDECWQLTEIRKLAAALGIEVD